MLRLWTALFLCITSVVARADTMDNVFKFLDQNWDSIKGTKRDVPPPWMAQDMPGKWVQFVASDTNEKYITDSYKKRCDGFGIQVDAPSNNLPIFNGSAKRRNRKLPLQLAWRSRDRVTFSTSLSDSLEELQPTLGQGVGDEPFNVAVYQATLGMAQQELRLARISKDLLVAEVLTPVKYHVFWLRCPTTDAQALSSETAAAIAKLAPELSYLSKLYKLADDGTIPFLKLFEGSWTLLFLFDATSLADANAPTTAELCKRMRVEVVAPYPKLPLLKATTPVFSEKAVMGKRAFELRFAGDHELLQTPEFDVMESVKAKQNEYDLPDLTANMRDPLSPKTEEEREVMKRRNAFISDWRRLNHMTNMPTSFTYIDENALIETTGPDLHDQISAPNAGVSGNDILWLRCPAL